jgi:hypothetical protein
MYMLSGGPSRFPRSAAALVALYSAGIYTGDEVRRALDYLHRQSGKAEDPRQDSYAMYGYYYAAQGMWQSGPDHWQKWFPTAQENLLKLQQEDGSWNDPIGTEYGTAMSLIVLQMPNNALPIFQR